MDAPGARGARASQDTVKTTSEPDASAARNLSPSDTAQEGHRQYCQSDESSHGEFEGSDIIDEEGEEVEEGEEEEEEDDDDDDEPRLKYAYLTKHLGSIYRNGDATSTFLVAGDKMIVGTHNGVIPIRVYQAHSASVTSISVSPFPPPLPNFKSEPVSKQNAEDQSPSTRSSTATGSIRGHTRSNHNGPVPAIPSNSIYIASSSIDGIVCISSLVDPKDVMKRNFGRPVQAVALSPEYKTDRTFISGGRAGELVLTTGGRIGVSSNATTMGGATAAASSWLGSMGLSANSGKDIVLHSGEGTISTVRWSLSGKYVTWVNEEGIKIMRSNLHLESTEAEFAWKRISHIDRPNRPGWEEMASVWRARAEWVDQFALDNDDSLDPHDATKQQTSLSKSPSENCEKLVVGWGGSVWVIDVFPDRANKSSKGEKYGSAEVSTILRTDCVISGISLYSPRLLVLLAFIEVGDESTDSSRRGSGRGHRQRGLEPELRIIDIETKEELSADTLSVSRFEGLASSDYHLSVLPPWKTPEGQVVQRGALGALGHGLLDATMHSARLFSSGASIRSSTSSGDKMSGRVPPSFVSKISHGDETLPKEVQVASGAPGSKIFIHSPFDCVIAVKRDLSDRISWLDSHGKYEEAWNLVDENPEAIESYPELPEVIPGSAKSQSSLGEFFADDRSSLITPNGEKSSAADRERARLGERWIEQLVKNDRWNEASEVCGKVLKSQAMWEHWTWVFLKKDKVDEISAHIPLDLHPSLSSSVYEYILKYYIARDLNRFKELVDVWPSNLFDSNHITSTIEDKLKTDSMRTDSEEWRILTDCLARLFLEGGHYREALHCYIRLQDADAVMSLILEHRLVDAVSDDIPAFVKLRVSKEQLKPQSKTMSQPEISQLQELTAEPIQLLASEAYTGIVPPKEVVSQLESAYPLFLYFYLRALWRGESLPHETSKPQRGRGAHARDAASKLAADEGKALIDKFADIAVEVFARYDRPLLMEFLQISISYDYETAISRCIGSHFTAELIYLYSKTGQTKKALTLILSDLKDVSQAISFAKSQDDPDLWEDLLDYSMDKPKFIHGLLVEAGTSIDPIKLVRRIPSGLEIEGLRDGLTRLIREYDLQDSISQGATRVMQGEVVHDMDKLYKGRRRGIKFNITESDSLEGKDGSSNVNGFVNSPDHRQWKCGGCHAPFLANERETLIGFPCGHVFHLSHLHSKASRPQSDAGSPERHSDSTPRAPQTSTEDFAVNASRNVGRKVLRARILRDKVGDGCRTCALTKKIESLGNEGET